MSQSLTAFEVDYDWRTSAVRRRRNGVALNPAGGELLRAELMPPLPAGSTKKRPRFPHAYAIVAELMRCLMALSVAYALSIPVRHINALLAPVHLGAADQIAYSNVGRMRSRAPTWQYLSHQGTADGDAKDLTPAWGR